MTVKENLMLTRSSGFLLLLLLLMFPPVTASAAEKSARIIFISSDGVYVGAGTEDSLAVGDTLFQGNLKMQVTAAAGRSSVAVVLPPDSAAVLEVGSQVRYRTTVTLERQSGEENSDPLPESLSDEETSEISRFSAAVDSVTRRSEIDPMEYRPPQRFHGQLQQNLGLPASGNLYMSSRIGLQIRLYRPLPLNLDLSGTVQETAEGTVPLLYRLELYTGLLKGRLELGAGRLSPGEIAGLGALDGLKLGYHLGPRWTAGILAGMRINDYNTMIYTDGAKPGGGIYLRRDGRVWKGQLSLMQEYLPVTRYDIYGHPVRFEPHQEIIYSMKRSVPQGLDWSLRGNLIRDDLGPWLPQRLAFSTGFRNKEGFYWRSYIRSQIIRTDSLITFSEFERIIEDFSRTGMTHSLGFRAVEGLHFRVSHSSQVFSSGQDLPDVLTLSGSWRQGIYVSTVNLNQVFSETVSRRYDLNLSRQGKHIYLQPGWRLWQSEGLNREQSLYLNSHIRSGRWSGGLRTMLTQDMQNSDLHLQHYLSAGYRW